MTSMTTGGGSNGPSPISKQAATAAASTSPGERACTVASGSPRSTRSPAFASTTMPTAWSTDVLLARAAGAEPHRRLAERAARGTSARRLRAGAGTATTAGACGSGASGSPPWAAIQRR